MCKCIKLILSLKKTANHHIPLPKQMLSRQTQSEIKLVIKCMLTRKFKIPFVEQHQWTLTYMETAN